MKMSEREFLNLIEENQNIIHKVCRIYTDTTEDHADLFQEILLQLWQSYKRFKGESKVTTWMYRVALYTSITSFKRKLQVTKSKEELSYGSTSYEMEDQFKYEGLHMAIENLDDHEKAVILLHLDERPYREISEILGITENHVGVKVNRIKKKLKSVLAKI